MAGLKFCCYNEARGLAPWDHFVESKVKLYIVTLTFSINKSVNFLIKVIRPPHRRAKAVNRILVKLSMKFAAHAVAIAIGKQTH